MLLSFVLCIITSIILYIAPHGRVAYWSDWRLWGLTKTQWGDLHLNLGLLLLLAGFLHLYFNWKPITAYLKNKAKQLSIFTVDFNVALTLMLLVGFGTYFEVPPISSVLTLSNSIKDAASITYGEPPYGHAELSSLSMFSQKVDLDLPTAIKLLKEAQIQFSDDSETIHEIAQINNIKPKQVYEIIKPASRQETINGHPVFPDSPPPGFGAKQLSMVCREYGLDQSALLQALSQKGIHVEADQSIKEIAAKNNSEPMAVFEMIKNAVL